MLIVIDQVLNGTDLHHARQRLATAPWQDGGLSAGSLARHAKRNQQLPDDSEAARELGALVLERLGRHPSFVSAALPRRLYPPKFNRYADGGHYGTHVDSAVMQLPHGGGHLRSDLSATLFLNEAADYDGGELEIETEFGVQSVKLAAGDLVLYPSSSLHRVQPVTRGARLASFFWIESLVADAGLRGLLYDLDRAIQGLGADLPPTDPRLLQLTGVYHNLLRRHAST